MMRAFVIPGLAAATMLLCGTALAEPVVVPVAENAQAPERHIVEVAYAPFLHAHPEVRLLTAAADINNSGTDVIFVRFDAPITCVGSSCLYTVLSYDQATKRWKEVYSQHTEALALGDAAPDMSGGNPTRELVQSNGMRWRWTGGGINDRPFKPVLESIGKPWASERMATKAEIAAARPFLGDASRPAQGIRLSFTARDIELGNDPAVLVTAMSTTFCGDDGCPFVIVDHQTKSPRLLFKGFGSGAGAVMSSTANAMPNLAVESRDGLDFLQFNSAEYTVVQTTYSSKITPAP